MKFPIYLDNHSTTPVDPEVMDAMLPYFTEKFGNAASKNHVFGWEAESAVEHARKQIADIIGAESSEIYFTSGATESINLAHFGIAQSYSNKGKRIITSATEHSAVLDSLRYLEKNGFEIIYLPVDQSGRIDFNQLSDSINQNTILVSIMTANNEIGTINNVTEISKICADKNVFFHTDAAQALGKIEFDVKKIKPALASFSAHKLYGPKGIGAIYIRKDEPPIRLTPLLLGGGHEKNIRSGTLNVPGIVGFGKAVEICSKIFKDESHRISRLRDKLYNSLISFLDNVHLNGKIENRLPGNLNISFEGVTAESLIMEMRELAVSTGAACTTASLKPSHVLKAIGVPDNLAKSSIRFGIGRFNSEEEIDYAIKKIIESVTKLRSLSPSWTLREEHNFN
jgi:cysteine desulfurase